MGYRDEIDMEKLNPRERDLINMIDRNIAFGLEDIKNGRVHTGDEVLNFLMGKLKNKSKINSSLIHNQELIGIIA